MIWLTTLVCIFLLPFFSAVLFKTGLLSLYGVLLICLLCLVLRSGDYPKKGRSFLLPLISFLAIVIITSFFAVSPAAAFNNAFYFILYAIIFVVLAGLNPQKKKQIGLVLITASFFVSVIALLQRFFYFDRVIPYMISQRPFLMSREFFYLMDIIRTKRVISIFTTPNLLASYLVMINLVALGYIFSEDKRRNILFLTLLLIINSYCLWLTGSFMGIISLFIGFLLFILMLLNKDKKKLMRYGPIFIALFFCLLIMVIALALQRWSGSLYRYNLIFALEERLRLWKFALGIIADRPFSFAGLGNFANIYRNYMTAKAPESVMAHNLFMQLWIEAGPYGVLAFIWFLITFMRDAIRSIFNKDALLNFAVLQIGIFSALFAFLVHNMAGFSFFVPQAAIIWWILCALLINDE